VASADLTNLPLLDHLVQKGKPLILSTGMSRMDEVEFTVNFLKERRRRVCPAALQQHLPGRFRGHQPALYGAAAPLRRAGRLLGHERGIAVSTVAAAMGASIIERHITLDRTMDGPDHAASLEPQGFQKMVRDIRQVPWPWAPGKRSSSRAARSSTARCWARAWSQPGRSSRARRSPPRWWRSKGRPWVSRRSTTRPGGPDGDGTIEEDEPFLERDLGIKVTLDLAHSLPMEWGFTVRFRDFEEMLVYQPRMLEFHFTDQDLDEHYPGGDPAQAWWSTPRVLGPHAGRPVCQDERQRGFGRPDPENHRPDAGDGPHFIGTPKVIVHPGAMSLDHPMATARCCTTTCAARWRAGLRAGWSCCWKTCRRTPGISAASG
jgi:hypothetical protein